jgi:hypothetical protein
LGDWPALLGLRLTGVPGVLPRAKREGAINSLRQQVYSVDSITVSQARERLYRLLDEVTASREPVPITGKRVVKVLRMWTHYEEVGVATCGRNSPRERSTSAASPHFGAAVGLTTKSIG